jgi:hypothetical protein
MSQNSYCWRGELNHPGMISIISSGPDGPQRLPEKSFTNRLLWNGITLPFHRVAYWSQLAKGVQFPETTAPLLVTCCAGGGAGIGYHVRIEERYGNIKIFDICSNDRDNEHEFQIFLSSPNEEEEEAEAGGRGHFFQ